MSEFVTSTAGDRIAYDRYGTGPALVFVAGIYLPPALVTWFQNVARVLG